VKEPGDGGKHDGNRADDRSGIGERGLMGFGDHLEELRKRVLLSLALPAPLAITAFFFAPSLRAVLCEPAFRAQRASGLPASLQVLSPTETIGADMHLALVVALVVSAPWILWQVWKFVEPGLYASEKRFVRLLIPASALLTVAGLSLLYFVMLPLMLQFLVSFGGPSPIERDAATNATNATNAPEAATAPDTPAAVPQIAAPSPTPAPFVIPILKEFPTNPWPGQMWLTPEHELRVAIPIGDGTRVEIFSSALKRLGPLDQQFRLREYLDFVLTLMLATAIAFQLPLVMMLLGWIGVFEVSTLRHYRRHAFFVCVILAAIITPTVDPISMSLMAVPLYGLFELGIILLVIAPPRAVAEGSVWQRAKDLALGRGRVKS